MKDQWIAEEEEACELFWEDSIDEVEFRTRMIHLGFNHEEVDNHIEAMNKDLEND